jgi:hypothetical protein
VVLPPSRGASRQYEIIEGRIDDLSLLVPIKTRLIEPPTAPRRRETVGIGRRNDVLFRTCMRDAHHCDDLDALLDVARTFNADDMRPPLDDAEVVTIASSAWGYTERGKNRVGQSGAWLPQSTINALVRDPLLFALIGWLKAANGPDAHFLVTNSFCEYLGWSLGKLRQARRRAIETGWIVKIRREAKGVAALFCWGPAFHKGGV